jgi:iduronate 2-sulfatase
LAVGFYRPHCPYIAPKKYFDMYPIEQIKLPEQRPDDLKDVPAVAPFVKPANWGLKEDDLRQARRAYYASATFMDAQVGKVLDAVERLGLADNTIILFWGDHGYALGEHGQWMKMALWEEQARVPLIVAVPGMKGNGKTCERIVETLDFYPTLADLSGYKVPVKFAGMSLRPLLEDPSASWSKPGAYTQVNRAYKGKQIMGRSIRTDRWRYTEWDEGRLGSELYDHESDPHEFTNLAEKAEMKETIDHLKQLLHSPS